MINCTIQSVIFERMSVQKCLGLFINVYKDKSMYNHNSIINLINQQSITYVWFFFEDEIIIIMYNRKQVR